MKLCKEQDNLSWILDEKDEVHNYDLFYFFSIDTFCCKTLFTHFSSKSFLFKANISILSNEKKKLRNIEKIFSINFLFDEFISRQEKLRHGFKLTGLSLPMLFTCQLGMSLPLPVSVLKDIA